MASLVVEDGGRDGAEDGDAFVGDCRLGEDPCGDQVCNVSTGQCEACQRDRQCDDGEICERAKGVCVCDASHHDCGGRCLPNDSPDSCGDRCEPCDGAEGGVATCVAGVCGVECSAPFVACSAGCPYDRPCVECLTVGDCADAANAACDDGRCVPCNSSSDCEHLGLSVCDGGMCVECTTASAGACGQFSCNPRTKTCTTTTVGSREWCESCVADSECEPNHRCIAMTYAGTPRADGYCLVEADDECLDVDPILTQRDSLSGVVGEFYCVIREDLVTCEAVKDFSRPCDQNDDCGVPGLEDALCRIFDGARQCTYRCATSIECANGTSCIGNPPDNSYCAR